MASARLPVTVCYRFPARGRGRGLILMGADGTGSWTLHHTCSSSTTTGRSGTSSPGFSPSTVIASALPRMRAMRGACWRIPRIDLAILDIMMPGEDGLSLCRDLRAKSDAAGDHADRHGRGDGSHRRAGGGRRRLSAEAVQPAGTAGAHQGGPAADRAAAARRRGIARRDAVLLGLDAGHGAAAADLARRSSRSISQPASTTC